MCQPGACPLCHPLCPEVPHICASHPLCAFICSSAKAADVCACIRMAILSTMSLPSGRAQHEGSLCDRSGHTRDLLRRGVASPQHQESSRDVPCSDGDDDEMCRIFYLNGRRYKGTGQILEWEQDSWFMSSSALTPCDPGSVSCPLWARLFKSRGGDWAPSPPGISVPVSFTQDTHPGGPWEWGLHSWWARGPGWWLRGVKKDSVDLPFPTPTTQTWLCVPYWNIPWAERAGIWADSWIDGPGQSLSALWEEGW